MALTLSSCPRVSSSAARRHDSCRNRSRTVAVKALTLQEASNWIGQAFVRIFSPPENNIKNFPTNAWTGRISRDKKPFKDGYINTAPLPPTSAIETNEDAVGYVEDAVKGVVAGFPKDEEAPQWSTGAPTGWKGDIHKSDNKRDAREGFHLKRH